MRKSIILILVVLGLILSANAEQGLDWNITKLRVYESKWIGVKIDSDFIDVCNGDEFGGYCWLSPDQLGHKEMYSVLLTAKPLNKRVAFFVKESCGTENRNIITSVVIE